MSCVDVENSSKIRSLNTDRDLTPALYSAKDYLKMKIHHPAGECVSKMVNQFRISDKMKPS